MRRYSYRRKEFDFGDFEITKREILASTSIIAVMLLIGVLISGKISEHQMDKNEIYNKAVKIESTELFQHGMDTDVGNAFVHGNLEAVDIVTYPELGGKYIYVKKVKERYERYERVVTKKDSNGKKYTEVEVYYEWEIENTESLHANKIKFCGIEFPYSKIDLPSPSYVKMIKGDKEYSWKSGERVKVRYKYYGIETKFTGTIFTDLRENTISDNSSFYNDMSIAETVEHLESGIGIIIFWIFWVFLICACVFSFYYLDNKWLG